MNCLYQLQTVPLKVLQEYKASNLYVRVTKGPLKGTFGVFHRFECHNYHIIRWWPVFVSSEDLDAVECFTAAVKNSTKPIKISIALPHNQYCEVSINSCEFVFGKLYTEGKVSTIIPKVKNEDYKIPDVYDHLGEEINIGDFCSYILYHHRHNGARIYYGTVTKITKNGDVYCQDINLGDWLEHDTPKEKKVLHPSMITIMNDTLMDRIMLARLSS